MATKTRARTSSRPKATRARNAGGTTANVGKKAFTEAVFKAYGLPGWLGWGTAGAESTYGTNGSYAFGGIDLPNSGGRSYAVEARESAKAYAGLVKQYGSVAAAIPHYSGNSYTIGHVTELARGGAPQANEKISGAQVSEATGGNAHFASFLGDLLGGLPGGGPALKAGVEGAEALGVDPGSIEGDIASSILPEPIINFFSIGIKAVELLIDIHFWIRVGEVLAGVILIHMGLKELTGQGILPGDLKGKAIDGAAALAATA